LSAILVGFVACFVLIGCGNKASQESSQRSAPAEPVLTLDPATLGSITGKVVLDGSPPPPKTIDMDAEAACVKAHATPVDFPEVVRGERGALANVAVYVKSGLGNYHFDTPKDPVVLNQTGCMYDPHVLALMVGQPLEVVNGDPVLHNIHVIARDNRSWNRSETAGMEPFEETFLHPELGVIIKCNVHPWMRAFAFVFSHPYFVVTTERGTFDLENLPPGTYTIEAWQEKYGVQDQTVTIGPKESKAITFTFKAAGAAGS
jgi:plastocyanin